MRRHSSILSWRRHAMAQKRQHGWMLLKKRGSKDRGGLVRDLNPGPLAPKARIIPLDQRATGLFSTEADVPRISLCSMLQSLRHSALCGKCKMRAQATGQISEKLDFVRTCASMACIRSIFLIKHQEQNTLSELNGRPHYATATHIMLFSLKWNCLRSLMLLNRKVTVKPVCSIFFNVVPVQFNVCSRFFGNTHRVRLLTGAWLKQLFSIPVLAPNALHILNVSLC